jgi:hypothetical protein
MQQKKLKDMQPPYQEAHEGLGTHESEGKREPLTSGEIGEQASGKEADEIQREILRQGENDEAADDKDIAGSADTSETPQGREEAKNDTRNKANSNG